MKTVNLLDRPLSEAELSTINHFAELTSTPCFACLGPQVCVILPPLAEENVDDLINLVRERMAATDTSVDYSKFYMPDGTVIVGLPGGVCAMSDGESEGEPSTILMLRHMVIDTCAEGNISAIVFNYE